MIIKTIRFRNFFSSGNSFIEIDLLKYKKTAISGSNGNGKSTINSAIVFALFGKTIKKVTKSQIVNSINQSKCLVEIEFSANNNEYLIRRGIKPNIFEIHENGVLIDQPSVSDYQDYLEEKILFCNFRTFCQTSIISIENYTPFMSLDKASRREFIEDILDIRIFSTMNQLTKTKVSKNKEELKLVEVSLKSAKDKIMIQKSHIDQLEAKKAIGVHALDAKLVQYSEEIESATLVLNSDPGFDSEIAAIKISLNTTKHLIRELNLQITTIRSQIRASEKDISFFEAHADCPTCRQAISEKHVCAITDSQKEANMILRLDLSRHEQELEKYSEYDNEVSKLNQRESKRNSVISVANSTVTQLNRQVASVNKEKLVMLQDDDVAEQKIAMSDAAKIAMKLRDRQLAIVEEQSYNTIMLELFKDSGIKAKIVDQYIGTINRLVNEYLERLDFFVSFTLDSEFNETIKSRHRDDFTYSSFSAGERVRIDMALLFTFRQLAKMRNSFSCNLLVMDEICDSSSDSAGVELLIGILQSKEFDDSNIMVISHGNIDRFQEAFDGFYEVTKRDGFSVIT